MNLCTILLDEFQKLGLWLEIWVLWFARFDPALNTQPPPIKAFKTQHDALQKQISINSCVTFVNCC